MRPLLCIAVLSCAAHAVVGAAPPEHAPPEHAPPAAAPAATEPAATSDRPAHDPRYGVLTPIPDSGGLPPLYSKMYELTPEELAHRAAQREYARQLRQLRHRFFGPIKVEKLRKEGIAQLKEFTDPAAFGPMIKELAQEKDDVRLAMLDHFATQGEEGQAALGWVVIYDKDAAIQNEAMRRMTSPVSQPVLFVVDNALRSSKAEVANSAAVLVNSLHIIQAIPLLIFAQANVTENDQAQGDLAWIAIQTQRAYVAGLQPVVGSGAGAFQPIIGVVSEGAILRVMDAVVIEYRTVVHSSLVNLTSLDWGQPTEQFGYNLKSWWKWYNDVYLPLKAEGGASSAPDSPPAGSSGTAAGS